MRVYRVSRTQYAKDLEGTGAKLYGGRWNSVNIPCVYTSESRALAVLEYSVNSEMNLIPRALSICIFEIDPKKIKEISIEDLPGNWKDIPSPFSTKKLGSKFLTNGGEILKIPSIVIEDEFNYILNPLSKDRSYKLVEIHDFIYDLRIKSNS